MLGFIFILFSFSLAAASCDDSQTIMRLYSPTNSHVSAWDTNVADYTEEICYNDIFGFDYDGASPHDCNEFNRILSLYSPSNSHASEITDANYDYEVCYGDLNCVYDTSSGDSCAGDGEVVARLYSSSNTHISTASDSNYPIKVCCVASDLVYWADMNGNKITEADYQDVVQLIGKGMGSGDFEIKEDDLIGSDDIKTVSGESIGVNWVGNWVIGSDDLDKTNDYDNFYFDISGEESDELIINTNGNDDPMSVDILSPICGMHYDEGDDIVISVMASDADDIITGTVKINGNEVNFTNGGVSFNQLLDVSGNVQVVVEASNTRGERSRIISNIMVLDKQAGNYIDGEYVAACIDKPKDFTNIPGSSVEFDASTTRGVSVVGGVVDELIPGEDEFSWYWVFYPEDISRNLINTTDEIAYKFTANFPIAGDNSASLRVEI